MKSCLRQYSVEDIDNKLIPFKRKQFDELQTEEAKLKQQLGRVEMEQNIAGGEKVKCWQPDKKVAPLKLSLRGVVVRAGSSSCSNDTEPVEENSGKVLAAAAVEESGGGVDDNAVFPSLPIQPSYQPSEVPDVSKDLFLSDDSDVCDGDSPVKKQQQQIAQEPPTTPAAVTVREEPTVGKVDLTSPQAISSLLKSPFHSRLVSLSEISKKSDSSNGDKQKEDIFTKLSKEPKGNGMVRTKKPKKKAQLSRSTTTAISS